LTSAPGNRLFQPITGNIPPDLTALVHYVIDRLLVDADRELMRLVYSNPFRPDNDSNTQTSLIRANRQNWDFTSSLGHAARSFRSGQSTRRTAHPSVRRA
jgi:hypothetical protein